MMHFVAMPLHRQTIGFFIVCLMFVPVCFADDRHTFSEPLAYLEPDDKGVKYQLLKVSKESPPRFPNIINPFLQTFDIESISIPDAFNYDVASVIVDANAQLYLSLNPDIIEQALPMSYGSKTAKFNEQSQEHWFVFFVEGEGVIDIFLMSDLDLQFEVLNQEGSTVSLIGNGRLNASETSAGFYYLRVMNNGQLGEDNSYRVHLTINILSGQGGEIHGVVSNSCNGMPIQAASVSIDTDFRFTHKDGSYEFLPKNAGNHNVTALAQGFKSTQSEAEVFVFQTTLVDLQLQPVVGCDNPDISGTELGSTPKLGAYQTPVVFNEFTGITDFKDVLATELPDGDKHFRVQLKQINGVEPIVLELTYVREIKTQNQNISAIYNYSNASLTIPVVQALGRLYSVELSHTSDYKFSINNITEITQ